MVDEHTLDLISAVPLHADVLGFMWWACRAEKEGTSLPEPVKRFLADTSVALVLQRCGFEVGGLEGQTACKDAQEERLNRFLDLHLGRMKPKGLRRKELLKSQPGRLLGAH